LLGGDLLHAALAILANRIVFNFGLSLRLRNLAPYLQLGWLFCSRKEVKRLFNPSVSYMFVSIAQALTIQGPVVILGLIANPDQVVIFSTSRTLARLGTSASNILTFSVTPEYSRLFGLGEISRFLHIMRLHFALASAGTLIYTVFTRLTGGFILNYWTKGQVTIVEPFFTLLVLSVAAEMIWTTLFTPLAAINRHIIVSYSFAFLSIAGIGACYFLASAYGLIGIGIALLVIHLVMVVISSKEVISRKPSSVDEMFLDKH